MSTYNALNANWDQTVKRNTSLSMKDASNLTTKQAIIATTLNKTTNGKTMKNIMNKVKFLMVAENTNVNQDVKSATQLLTLQNAQLAWMDLLWTQQLKNAWNVMTSVWLAIQIISKTAHHVILDGRYLELTLEVLHVQNAKLIIVGNAVQLIVAQVVKISTFCIWMIPVSLVWVIAGFVQICQCVQNALVDIS